MKSLILGAGEVGRGLYEVLSSEYPCTLLDLDPSAEPGVYMLHICFPYYDGFVGHVLKYKEIFAPAHTVIHSTVPPGTSKVCGAVHSPVRGDHFRMAESIRTFVKFVAGDGADAVAQYFLRAGIPVMVFRNSDTTEIGKLLCTTYYGTCIEYAKAAEVLCDKAGVPFSEAFVLFQTTYNDGYRKLGRTDVQRPVLAPIQERIGGHCVLQNCDLFDFPFADMIRRVQEGNR